MRQPVKCLFQSTAFILLTSTIGVAEPTKIPGDQFVRMMQSNTLSGTSSSGNAFNIYFLPGGKVSYSEKGGATESGTWHLDSDGDVCVNWPSGSDAKEGCFRVMADGNKLYWEGKQGSGRGVLRGGVTDTFLKANP